MEDLEVLKNKINLLDYILKDAPASKVKRSGRTVQLSPCPFCNKGIRTPHFTVYENSNSFNSFGCTLNGIKGGSIIDYIMAKEGIEQKEAVKKLYQITNTPFEEEKEKPKIQKKEEPKQNQEELEQINKFCLDGFKKMEDAEELKQYLKSRKISTDAINKYNLFISNKLVKGKKFLVIPIIEEGKSISYIGRNLKKDDNFRYKNAKGTIKPFNLKYIKEPAQKEQELLFICEGVFDAISIEEQGFKAISLNSTNNINKFINELKKNMKTAKSYKYIIATDTDEARTKSTRRVKNRINKTRIVKHNY